GEHHLAFWRRSVEQSEAAVAVGEESAGPRGAQSERVAIKTCTRVALRAEFYHCRLVDGLLSFAQRVAHRAIEERSGVHLAKAGVDPILVGGPLPRLEVSKRRPGG